MMAMDFSFDETNFLNIMMHNPTRTRIIEERQQAVENIKENIKSLRAHAEAKAELRKSIFAQTSTGGKQSDLVTLRANILERQNLKKEIAVWKDKILGRYTQVENICRKKKARSARLFEAIQHAPETILRKSFMEGFLSTIVDRNDLNDGKTLTRIGGEAKVLGPDSVDYMAISESYRSMWIDPQQDGGDPARENSLRGRRSKAFKPWDQDYLTSGTQHRGHQTKGMGLDKHHEEQKPSTSKGQSQKHYHSISGLFDKASEDKRHINQKQVGEQASSRSRGV